jgi:hypothetical protein
MSVVSPGRERFLAFVSSDGEILYSMGFVHPLFSSSCFMKHILIMSAHLPGVQTRSQGMQTSTSNNRPPDPQARSKQQCASGCQIDRLRLLLQHSNNPIHFQRSMSNRARILPPFARGYKIHHIHSASSDIYHVRSLLNHMALRSATNRSSRQV